MKKLLSIMVTALFICSLCANAATYNITPRAPKITDSLKPIIAKYKKGDYVGSMQDLEELVKVEKNNTYAKYYLALCYTRLGYKEEAMIVYKEVVKKDENLALSYYSQRALDCLENPNSEICNPQKAKEAEPEELDDMDIFIQSGRKIHPSAMDRITRERMERKMVEEEYIRTQKQQEAAMNNQQLQSYNQPTNEEIASALNTLSKIGMNPYNQFNPLAQAQQYQNYGLMGINNPMMMGNMMNNASPEIAKMMMYSQMTQQGNMLNYGI